jgi:hypothetical protein
MLTYDQMTITVREDDITSMLFRMDEGYDGFSFYADTKELISFLKGERGSPEVLRDIFRVAVRFGERITFADLSDLCSSRDVQPKLAIRAYNMHLPRKVAAILIGRIEDALDQIARAYDHSITIEVTKEERAAWLDYYGQGKGTARFEFTSDEVKNKFEAKLAEYANKAIGVMEEDGRVYYRVDRAGSPEERAATSFHMCVEHLRNMAKNTTWTRDEVGVVRIGPDWAGFTFSAGGMYGGLIFHESSGEWSCHS